MKRVISLINLKGGVGKTTTAIEMGYLLSARYKARVLLVDNDKQGNLSRALGVYQGDTYCGTAKLMDGQQAVPQPTRIAGCDVISANMTLLTATYKSKGHPNGYQQLRRIADREGKPYQFIIIDNPPDLGINVLNALFVSQDVIVPTKIDQWALEGLDVIRDQVQEIRKLNQGLHEPMALVTMYRNTSANAAGVEWLRDNGYKHYNTMIRYSDKAVENTFFGQAIQEYSPRSAAALSYRKFTGEYLESVK